MSYFLDIAGSVVVGAIVLLILTTLNLNISAASGENLFLNIAQRDITTTAEVLEHDLYKIGYRIPGEKIAIADSSEIKFYADIDDDGIDDSIHYFLSDLKKLSNTPNPNDRVLYRDKNDDAIKTEFSVVRFNLSYCDSSGQQINYASLSSSAEREKIKSINTDMKMESHDPIDGNYLPAEWKKKITPKNLR